MSEGVRTVERLFHWKIFFRRRRLLPEPHITRDVMLITLAVSADNGRSVRQTLQPLFQSKRLNV